MKPTPEAHIAIYTANLAIYEADGDVGAFLECAAPEFADAAFSRNQRILL